MNVVLITGCSSGFGLVSALAFARRGDRVYASMRNLSKAGDLKAVIEAERLPITPLQLDVTDDESVKQAVLHVLKSEGRIDVLVNNAGMGCLGPVEFLSDDMLRSVFETNFFGVVRMLRAVLPTMREQNSGVVVNVSSIDGRIPGRPINWAYSSTKHSLGVLSDALALEVESFGIKVRLIEPGFFATKISDNRVVWESRVSEDRREMECIDSPYRTLEEAVKSSATKNMAKAADPQIVADAIVEAANEKSPFPVHYPVGDDAVAALKEIDLYDEEEQATAWKRMVGL
ncbi:SDR family oxidoreductase [Pseudalkalibacillus decolorationis]|uniref:SDR family oxidoreductase n=1 Tax=Pseudalkalibacillus decolorationis TaxID=163879 RepID=UPI00214772A4|nr:SDR family oxidoreductase [Pseudalkalibacillus decolorationis]